VLQQVGIEPLPRPQLIVRSSENYRVDVLSNDWWGEPLAAMLSRVIVAELAQRFPQSIILRENGGVSSSPDATVEVNVQRLDEDAAGSVVMRAQAGVQFKGQKASAVRSFQFAVTPRRWASPDRLPQQARRLASLPTRSRRCW
jgi:uncharacterized lipoprotein YmbA